MADKTSPLDGLLKVGHHGKPTSFDEPVSLKISHRLCESLVQITAWAKTHKNVASSLEKITGLKVLGENRSSANDDFTLMPTGPGGYLIESTGSNALTQFQKKIPPAKGSVTDLGHARVVIRISGNQAVWVLAKGIAVDFSIEAFPIETSRNTSHHEIGLTIRRVDEDSFDLYIFTSLARSFWHWLNIAASEVGYEIVEGNW